MDEAAQAQFYATRIPLQVNSVAGFESWWRDIGRGNPEALHMSLSDLTRREAPEAGGEYFPSTMNIAGNPLPLSYLFEPGTAADGITLSVPEPLLEALDAEQLAWLVPGARQEKIAELLRSLPKAIRRQIVPVTDQARLALESVTSGPLPPFHSWLAGWITARAGTAVKAADLAAAVLPDHLRLNIRVLDRPPCWPKAATWQAAAPGARHRRRGLPGLHRSWDFGPLPATARWCAPVSASTSGRPCAMSARRHAGRGTQPGRGRGALAKRTDAPGSAGVAATGAAHRPAHRR